MGCRKPECTVHEFVKCIIEIYKIKTDKKDAGADFFGHAPASFAVHIEEAPVVRWSDLVNFFTDIQHFLIELCDHRSTLL